jgi:hypothetical protein
MQTNIGAIRTFIKFDFVPQACGMTIFQGNHKGNSASGLAEITRSGLKNQIRSLNLIWCQLFLFSFAATSWSFFGNEKKEKYK